MNCKLKIVSALVLFAGLVYVGILQARSPRQFVVDDSVSFQEIEHFGASDCWSFQFVGLWPDSVTHNLADMLFSTEMDSNGKPKGIGLSLWRFNIGAGSAEQGKSSRIDSRWRRTECFLTPNGLYDWNKQKGQLQFIKLAQKHGVNSFLGFLNSPPVYYTKNGLATNVGRGRDINLKAECLDDFALFLANVTDSLYHLHGIRLNYISPLNEPDGHWNWTGTSQEGTPALNTEIAQVVKMTSSVFTSRGISTQIVLPEASDYNSMFRTHPLSETQRGYHVQTFFSSGRESETNLTDVNNVPRLLLGHSYWTTTPLDNLKRMRIQLNDSLAKYQVGFWESEYCIMANDQEIGGGPGFDPTIKTALYVARVIHHDLVYANARSWSWWLAAGGDYKDGLIRVIADESLLNGHMVVSKLLWVLGNYSRFIRPGAVRLRVRTLGSKGVEKADGETDPHGLMVSAFRNKDDSMVAVAVNYSSESQEICLGLKSRKNRFIMYRTSDQAGEDLIPTGEYLPNSTITIPPRSVTTFVSH